MSARKTFIRQNSHNSTFCHGSASKRFTSTPKNQALGPLCDSTLNTTTVNPKIKVNLMLPTVVNRDLEFDLIYNEYLQSLMRSGIILKSFKIQREDLEGQLAYRMDCLQKTTQSCLDLRLKMDQLDSIKNAEKLLDAMQETLDHFQEYCTLLGIEKDLQTLLKVLESESNTIYLKNVKSITEEEYKKLTELIELCSILAKNFSNFRDIEKIGQLADNIRNMKEIEQNIMKKHKNFSETQDRLGLLCLKQISDEFASKRVVLE